MGSTKFVRKTLFTNSLAWQVHPVDRYTSASMLGTVPRLWNTSDAKRRSVRWRWVERVRSSSQPIQWPRNGRTSARAWKMSESVRSALPGLRRLVERGAHHLQEPAQLK